MIKKVIILVLLCLSLLHTAWAKPPRLSGFQNESANKKFIAKIYANDKKDDDQLKQNESKFKVAVYKKENNSLLWKCDYQHTGYSNGILSDDGSTFVTICYRYSDDRPIVFVYQNGGLKKKITGKELPVNKSKLVPTSDGFMWRSENPCDFTAFHRDGSKFLLKINTVDGQIKVDLNTFEINK